jgi:hypothetical protein
VHHVELGAGPADIDPGVVETLISLVVYAIATRSFRIEHDAYIHAGVIFIDDGLNQTFLGERKLFDQKRSFRGLDKLMYRF